MVMFAVKNHSIIQINKVEYFVYAGSILNHWFHAYTLLANIFIVKSINKNLWKYDWSSGDVKKQNIFFDIIFLQYKKQKF